MVICNATKETVGMVIYHLPISHSWKLREQRIILLIPMEALRAPKVFLYIKFLKNILAFCDELLEVFIGNMTSEIIRQSLEIDLMNNSNVSCSGRDDLAKLF